jgi:hypothetical protein
MTDLPGDHPPPHPELRSQTPLIHTAKKGDVLYRHHRTDKDPIYFGMSGNNASTIPIVLLVTHSGSSTPAKIRSAASSNLVAGQQEFPRSQERT